MSGGKVDRPLIAVEEVGAGPTAAHLEDPAPKAPLIEVETLDSDDLARPEPDPTESASPPSPATTRSRSSWLVWSFLAGAAGLVLVGIVDWVLGLLARLPILGAPAVFAVTALMFGLFGLAWREVRALRRIRDVEEVRAGWEKADGERLQQLILRIGADLGETAWARKAADVVDDAGPEAARGLMSREVMATRDRLAGESIASAVRQGFVIVTASPSPALDALLLIARAARLLRQIAVAYGYRPGALALRSLALAAGRDAGAVAIADALTQAAAEGASHAMETAGDVAMKAGMGVSATVVGAKAGVALAALGMGIKGAGMAMRAAGGALGGGAVAAWRLYRFGLMVLVATRPIPFDATELAEIKAQMRAEALRLLRSQSKGSAAT